MRFIHKNGEKVPYNNKREEASFSDGGWKRDVGKNPTFNEGSRDFLKDLGELTTIGLIMNWYGNTLLTLQLC